jgi:hypothetical protein
VLTDSYSSALLAELWKVLSRTVKEPPALMPPGLPDKPIIPTIKSLLLDVVMETVELVPEEAEAAETAEPRFGSKGEAV